jgi:ParB/RepB/Spo0J family partition protein
VPELPLVPSVEESGLRSLIEAAQSVLGPAKVAEIAPSAPELAAPEEREDAQIERDLLPDRPRLVTSDEDMPLDPSPEYERRQSMPLLWRDRILRHQRGHERTPDAMIEIPLLKISTAGFASLRDAVDEEAEQGLRSSMDETGLLHPIVVTEDKHRPDHYLLLCGHRRFRIASELGWRTIRATVREVKSVAEAALLNIVENVSRKDMSPYELAVACERMVREFGIRSGTLAKTIGYSQSYVQNLIRMLGTLPPAVLEDWKAGHPLLVNKRLERLSHDPDAQQKWLTVRAQYARDENRITPTLEQQLQEIEDQAEQEEELGDGWLPYRRPTKSQSVKLRDVLARARLPEDRRQIREIMVGIVDYMRGATSRVPHVLTPPPRRRKTAASQQRAAS